MQWVEQAKPPAAISAKGKTFTRLLCAYPAAARYTGGNPNEAPIFTCAAPTP